MAKIFNSIGTLASGAISKATDTLSSKASFINNMKGKKEPGTDVPSDDMCEPVAQPDGMMVVDSVEGMNAWLDGFRPGASPSGLQCLKAQMQVISCVNSPNLVGMAVDTLFDSLYKAIMSSGDETEKQQVREAYASMIQNFFFFSEARLYYAIDKKKDEAISMLSTAGDMLTQSVTAVASLVSPVAAMQSGVRVKNMFTEGDAQKQFFSAILAWMNNKKKIEEQLSNYHTTLEQSFKMFDQYSELIGPSILIHGMLLKHKDRLIERFKEESYQPFDKSRTIKINNTLANLDSMSINDMKSVGGAIRFASALVSGMSGGSSTIKCDSLDSYFMRIDQIEEDLARVHGEIKDYQQEKTSLLQEKSQVGMFQTSKKKDINDRLELIESRLTSSVSMESKLTEMLTSFKDAFPEAVAVRKRLNEYEAELSRVVDKYAVAI